MTEVWCGSTFHVGVRRKGAWRAIVSGERRSWYLKAMLGVVVVIALVLTVYSPSLPDWVMKVGLGATRSRELKLETRIVSLPDVLEAVGWWDSAISPITTALVTVLLLCHADIVSITDAFKPGPASSGCLEATAVEPIDRNDVASSLVVGR